jgi:CSLREA domain-containing protein
MAGRHAVLVGVVSALLVAAAPATAATMTVTTTTDERTASDGLCSLREAIGAVNSPGTATDCGTSSSGANTIVLAAERYPLTLLHGLIIGPPPTGCFAGNPHTDDNANGDLSIAGTVQSLTIQGAGTSDTIVDACKLGDRALNVASGAVVTLRNLTITNGRPRDGKLGMAAAGNGATGGAGGAGENGGGILNDGTLTLIDSTVSDSQAGSGGAGAAGGFAGGTGGAGGAGGQGGGIFNDGTLTLSASTISANSAGRGGDGGNGTQGNSGNGGSGGAGATNGDGGGIANAGHFIFVPMVGIVAVGGHLTITNSTITGNLAGDGGGGGSGGNGDEMSAVGNGGNGGNGGGGAWGGGVSSIDGTLSATNSTIAGNSAGTGGTGGSAGSIGGDILQAGKGGDGGNGGTGGGLRISNLSGSQLTNLTIARNGVGASQPGKPGGNPNGAGGADGASGTGGGIYDSSAAVTVQNSILAGNTGGTCSGPITDGGFNDVPPSLSTHAGPVCPPAFTNGDPKLAVLADNGGPTQTMQLGPGSAAIDQIPTTGANCPQSDQRGVARPSGPTCDIGAYEVSPPAVSTGAATAITTTGAILPGQATANQRTATVVFKFGTSSRYGSQGSTISVGGLTPVAVRTELTGLKPHTIYHYSLVATSVDGQQIGPDRTFTTSDARLRGLAIHPAPVHRKTGATISYIDSGASPTTLIVSRCAKFAKRGHRCTRYKKVERFTHHDHAGRNSFHFSAAGLAVGHYRLSATPRAAARRRTLTTGFRVIT